MDIEYDPRKAASNLKKHGVSFDVLPLSCSTRWRLRAKTMMPKAKRALWLWAHLRAQGDNR